MNIIIYGGTSFIGRSLVDYLKKTGNKVANISRKINKNADSNYSFDCDINAIIDQFHAEMIIYLSADFNNTDISSLIDVNVKKQLEIISKLTGKDITYVSVGSYWQFGDKSKPDIAIDLYSCSKKTMSNYFDYYNTYTNIECKEIVLFGTYGISDNRGKLLDLLVEKAKYGNKISVTEGFQELNLVNVEDVVINIAEAIKNTQYRKLAIRSSKSYTLRELVKKINKYVNLDARFGEVPYRDVELMKINFSSDYYYYTVDCKLDSYIRERLGLYTKK